MTAAHFLAGLILVGTIAALSIPDSTISGAARVIDGNTIRIRDGRIRIWGIDAPELDQPLGPEATQHLYNQVKQNVVTCHPRDTDKWGRIVAQCFVMDRDLGLSQVANGLALDYTRYSHGYYEDAQDAARQERLGMWAGEFTSPEAWRRGGDGGR